MKAYAWIGFPPEAKDIPFESVKDIEDYISKLECDTDLILQADDESTLTVSKANISKYNVAFIPPGTDILFYLTNKNVTSIRNSKELRLYKEITYSDSMKAVHYYFENNQMNPQQYWLELEDVVNLKEELWSKTGDTGKNITLLN